MKKIFYLALFMPVMFASCSQEDKAENATDIPTVEKSFKVASLPAANIVDAQGTRVWSETTREWEAPSAEFGLRREYTDRIALVYHAGWSGVDELHNGVFSGFPFTSIPQGNILTLICDTPSDGGADTGDNLPWRAFGSIYVGSYSAFYPISSNINSDKVGQPIKFDISAQKLNTNYFAAYKRGAVYVHDGLIGVAQETDQDHSDDQEISVRLVPVSSLLTINFDLSNYADATIKKVEIANVGTGFEYYPQEAKAFGFSAGTVQKTAAELVASDFSKEYQEGTITLEGEAKATEGILTVYAWVLPVVAYEAAPAITLTDAEGNEYEAVIPTEGADAFFAARLTKFNTGFTLGARGLQVVKK